jgi:hypothetical protein
MVALREPTLSERPRVEARLLELADNLRKAFGKVQRHHVKGIAAMCRCGQYLREAKKLYAHGDWLDWVSKHFPGSYPLAAKYMQLSRVWDTDAVKDFLKSEPASITLEHVLDVARQEKAKQRGQESKEQAKGSASQHKPPITPAEDKADIELNTILSGIVDRSIESLELKQKEWLSEHWEHELWPDILKRMRREVQCS